MLFTNKILYICINKNRCNGIQVQTETMEKLIEQLLKLAGQNPYGFTVRIPDLEPVTKGWVVAKKETQDCFGIEGLKKVIALSNETTKIVGFWKDEKLYWDTVMTFENEDEATQAGIENGQLAIFNLDTFTEKRL